jgi:hypothetical protein
MIKPTKEINDFLSVLRILLRTGIVDKRELVDWADKEISKSDAPADYLIEFSLIGAKNVNEICELMDRLSDNSKSRTSGRALVGLIADAIKKRIIDHKRGFEILYSVQSEFELTELEKNYINHADDGLELALNQVWGDNDEVQSKIKSFLKCYQGFTLNNVDEWSKISFDVEERLKLWRAN